MEENLVLTADLTNLLDGLHYTDLIVHMDHGADESVWSNRALKKIQIDQTILANWKIRDLKSIILQTPARIKNALMVDLSRDDMALLVTVEGGETLERQVVRLGCTAREDDLLSRCADEVGHVLTGLFASLLRFPAVLMRA